MARPSITQLPPTGLERFRGLLTRADDLTGGLLAAVPGIGTLAALNRSGNAAQAGDYTKAVESLTDVVPVGRLATRAIKGLTKGRSTGDVGGVLNIRAPQQDALELAQKRAALPVSEGGLGLPPDNTPMDRARAMGFDVDNPLYHATNQDITQFKASKTGKFGPGVYTSQEPSMAEKYIYDKESPLVMPLLQRGERLDSRGDNQQQLDALGVPSGQSLEDWMYPRSSRGKGANPFAKLNKAAKESGMASVEYKAPWMENVVVDPSALRSRFAAFDPFRRNENDLLAFRGNMASSNLLNINPLLGLLDYENQ